MCMLVVVNGQILSIYKFVAIKKLCKQTLNMKKTQQQKHLHQLKNRLDIRYFQYLQFN